METLASRVVCEAFDSPTLVPLAAVTRQKRSKMGLGFGKILIVDDNDIDQLRATILSSDLGATVEVVNSGRLALATLEASHDVRLVLMDCEMPEMSGLETTRQWRQIERGWRSAIPIIGLSRRGSSDYMRCLAAGMNDCLRKPLNRDEVARCFARWSRAPLSTETYSMQTVRFEG